MPTPLARRTAIFERRRSGATFRVIGEEFGISRSRAEQLYARALLDQKLPMKSLSPTSPIADLPLSARARNALADYPEIRIVDVLAQSSDQRARRLLPIANFGRAQLIELELALSSFEKASSPDD